MRCPQRRYAFSENGGPGPVLRSRFRRDPVHLFFEVFFLEANALQDAFRVLDHLGVTAEIGSAVFGGASPLVGVFSENVVGAARLALPLVVFVSTADRGHVRKPWSLTRISLQFLAITELPRAACAIQQV